MDVSEQEGLAARVRVGGVEVFGGPKEPVEGNDDEVLDVSIEDTMLGVLYVQGI